MQIHTYLDSGERRPVQVEKGPKRRGRPDNREEGAFLMTLIDGLDRLSMLKLTGTDWRVLAQLVIAMRWDGETFEYSPTRIAETLEVNPGNVARSIKRLRELGIVIPRGRAHMLLHPDYFWRGDGAARKRVLNQLFEEGVRS